MRRRKEQSFRLLSYGHRNAIHQNHQRTYIVRQPLQARTLSFIHPLFSPPSIVLYYRLSFRLFTLASSQVHSSTHTTSYAMLLQNSYLQSKKPLSLIKNCRHQNLVPMLTVRLTSHKHLLMLNTKTLFP